MNRKKASKNNSVTEEKGGGSLATEKKGFESWLQLLSGIITAVVVVILGFTISKMFDLGNRMAVLQTEFERLKVMQFENEISVLKDRVEKMKKRIKEMEKELGIRSEEIPISAGWKAEGPGAAGIKLKEDGLELMADLKGEKSFVELYLDLRFVLLPNIDRNPDKSVNLAGKTLIAVVSSNEDFKGDQNYPNGAQFILKTGRGNIDGTWLDINEAMNTSNGMKIFFAVPYDNSMSREVIGISLKFTIGSHSTSSFGGSFLIKNVEIRRK